jgi:hypothetical protein
MVERLSVAPESVMTTRVVHGAGTRRRLPAISAAPGLFLSLAATAALAEPPGVQVSSTELVAGAPAERSSAPGMALAGHDDVRPAAYTRADSAETAVEKGAATGRGDAGSRESATGGKRSLESLVAEFLESI